MDQNIKKTVTPSTRLQKRLEGYDDSTVAYGQKPTTVEKDFIWYLKNVCGGTDKYEFETHDEAYKFGWALRDKHGDKIKVEIAVTTVRVWAVNDTPKDMAKLPN